MPRTLWLFSIRHTTTIIFVDSNLNMIQGDLRHMDRSTTITNRDAFNVESTVNQQQLPLSTSLAVGNDVPSPLVSPDPSADRHEHDIDKISDTRRIQPVEMTASVHTGSMAKTSRFDVDERESLSITAPVEKHLNRFTSVCKKTQRWIKRAL